jgi:pyrimidine-nucleoside phosphorylase
VCDSPAAVLPRARHRDELALPPGRITAIDSEALGIAAMLLGAGRRTTDDVIDPAAGLVVDAYVSEVVEPGAPPQVILCHGLSPGDARLGEARALIERAFALAPPDAPHAPPHATAATVASRSRILEVIR